MGSKVSFIVEKLKKSPLTVAMVLLVAVLILSAVAVASVFGSKRGDNAGTVKNLPQEQFIDEASHFTKLQNDIKALLFDTDLDRNAIIEQTQLEADGHRVYTIQIGVRAGEAEPLRQAVVAIMNDNKFAPLYTNAPYHLVMNGSEHRYELMIEELAAVESVAPIDNSNKPAATTDPELALPPEGNGKIALLIDDGGMNLGLAERLLKLDVPVALAILPHLPYSADTAQLVRQHGQTVFLHFPMEPLSYPSTDPGQGAVLVSTPELVIEQIAKQNVENLGSIDGFNNHMGSALTEDATKMAQVLKSMKPYSTNFVDSNTSTKTIALSTCQETEGYKCGLNRKFLDNENDHDYIRQKLYEMARLANKEGGIITIGHLRPDTITVLEEVVPKLRAHGYQFVPITALMK